MAAAVDDGGDAHARLPPYPESADALGTVDLVARERGQVDLHLLDVEGHLAHALDRVHVKQTPFSRVTSPSSAMGWTVPISLFASITETRMVFSVMASRSCWR